MAIRAEWKKASPAKSKSVSKNEGYLNLANYQPGMSSIRGTLNQAPTTNSLIVQNMMILTMMAHDIIVIIIDTEDGSCFILYLRKYKKICSLFAISCPSGNPFLVYLGIVPTRVCHFNKRHNKHKRHFVICQEKGGGGSCIVIGSLQIAISSLGIARLKNILMKEWESDLLFNVIIMELVSNNICLFYFF